MEKITNTALLKHGWKEDPIFHIIQYKKTINGFHYTLTFQSLKNNNWFDWHLHIDNPDFESVGSLEVHTFEDIALISQIYFKW